MSEKKLSQREKEKKEVQIAMKKGDYSKIASYMKKYFPPSVKNQSNAINDIAVVFDGKLL